MLLFRIASAAFVSQPGYTDAFYYFAAAQRLAAGEGLSVDLVWNFLEAPSFEPLPIPSHRFWMPLATVLQAFGIVTLGPVLGAFRAAQATLLLLSLLIPLATYVAARRLGSSERRAALAALVAGLGGAYAPAWASLDNFAPVALLGTVLFAFLPDVAAGRLRASVLAGAAVGGLALARADGALFCLALLVVGAPARALLTALLTALVVALPWYARDLALGIPPGQFARGALLIRYEDFFALVPPDLAHYLAAPDHALEAKAAALGSNLAIFVVADVLVLAPLALWEAWRRRDEPLARGWLAVASALYLAQSLVFTLHSTHGSYFHSFAGLFPLAIALGIARGAILLQPAPRRIAASALGAGALVLSSYALFVWADGFDALARSRRDVARSGAVHVPALVVDAAAWRAHLDGPTLVTPADGLEAARQVARRYGARTLVLEPIHFSAYDALYRREQRVEWLELAALSGDVVVYRILSP